jgi:predicted lipoprotein with Yx(FWY)xxD motif
MNWQRVLFASLAVLSLVVALSVPASTALASPPYASAPQPTPWLHLYQSSQWGYVLTDGNGWILYNYAKDKPGQSYCTGTCAEVWQPYLAVYGAAPQANWAGGYKLGVIQRPDGYYQVTYNDIPLYYYAQDQKAGDAYGNGYGGVWSVVAVKYTAPAPAYPPAQPYSPPQPYNNGGGY